MCVIYRTQCYTLKIRREKGVIASGSVSKLKMLYELPCDILERSFCENSLLCIMHERAQSIHDASPCIGIA